MATFDVNEWQQQIVGYTTGDDVVVPAMLPSGAGSVARVGTTNTFIITLHWDDDKSGSTGTTCPAQADTDLDCYLLTVFY